MCSIAGVLSRTPDESLLKNILQSQQHRGPDFQDSVTIETGSYQVQLGHNRLSIIDLSRLGSQPMWDSDKQYCITFNGEIYNYLELRKELIDLGMIFMSQSDTEVLLNAFKAWGEGAISRINGMFAFAIFDRKKNNVYLYRDRYGQKPLYYYVTDDVFCFASESQALVDHFNLTPNRQFLQRGLQYWLYEDGSENTVFENLQQLPAAHKITVDLGSSILSYEVKGYYELHPVVTDQQTFIEHLERSIDLRLRSDVPVGISLSGGLDSGSIAAIAARSNVQAFSFSDPKDPASEGPLVELLSRYLKLPVTYVSLKKENIIDAFWKTLSSQGAPFPGLSVVAQYLVYKKVKETGVKVLLGGQGGDEALLGYRKFLLLKFKKSIYEKKIMASLQEALYLLPIILSEIPRWRSYYQRSKQYGKNTPLDWDISQPLQQRQVMDLMQLSLPSLLRYEDRNSMAHGIESRMPFLDYQLMEYAVSLPINQKIKKGYGKWVLRDAMRSRLPKKICFARYKCGFDVPEKIWIQAGLGQSMRDAIQGNLTAIENYLGESINVNDRFSDKKIVHDKTCLNNAILLSWLSKQL